MASRSKLRIITFLTGVEVNRENQRVGVSSVVSQRVDIFATLKSMFTSESSEPHLAKKMYAIICGYGFYCNITILCFPTTYLR